MIDARKGLLAPLEVTDYSLHPSERDVNFIPDGPSNISTRGRRWRQAAAVLSPRSANRRDQTRNTWSESWAECARWKSPSSLSRLLTASIGKDALKRRTARCLASYGRLFSRMGVDILKMSIPVDAKKSDDPALAGCV